MHIFHKWSQWATFTQPMIYIIKGVKFDGEDKRQRRICTLCKKEEERVVVV